MQYTTRFFTRFALLLLLLAIVAGVAASFAYLIPGWFNERLPFHKLRPVHASAALFWVITGAAACVSYYSKRTSTAFMWIWMTTIVVIFLNYIFNNYGGREYWEFPVWLNLPLLVAWILFLLSFVRRIPGKAPVYAWMWTSGILFFLVTFLEQNLYNIPWFRESFLREVTVQWKANGAMVGAWNQMINGVSVFLLVALSGKPELGQTKKAYFLFFLGLFNMMFNWGHHVYNVPNNNWMRHVAYAVSMTEWVIILIIIRDFRKSLSTARKFENLVVYRFISSAEIWVAANLLLALFMSIPAINRYTHGTHITVAHAMGTTIGINTMLLLAGFGYMLRIDSVGEGTKQLIRICITINNICLGVFWLALIAAGWVKGYLSVGHPETLFSDVMAAVNPYLQIFTGAGLGVMIALAIITVLYLKHSGRREMPAREL
ncbi:MAG: cbb3-type cytochrome c oxidase subunit I [Candidatus Pseudobacter hemicellulosilyticus]|uniref:Cbb3-type cytochrome c oxidase subunit I n=1 Tax=Candidatus Pseudobacter hemicellulosilyticus TaxID=3121375 RepID=A0AAJ5WNJ9_9BACT|nr:MAG: cbb3-type cytochrome c oxidase subunit I [Pseudobacter sp.]